MPQIPAKNQSVLFNHGQPIYQSAHPPCSKDENNANPNESSTEKKQEGIVNMQYIV